MIVAHRTVADIASCTPQQCEGSVAASTERLAPSASLMPAHGALHSAHKALYYHQKLEYIHRYLLWRLPVHRNPWRLQMS